MQGVPEKRELLNAVRHASPRPPFRKFGDKITPLIVFDSYEFVRSNFFSLVQFKKLGRGALATHQSPFRNFG